MATQSEFERNVLEAIYKRRAIRSYQPGKLEEAAIRRLLDAAVHAPTAIHEEPWVFAVIQDPATLKRYSDRAKALNLDEASRHQDLFKAPGAATSPSHLIQMLADPAFNIFYNASTLIVIFGRPLSQYVSADCWLAAENLMLAACAMGLGTCCIGFAIPLLNTPEVKADLGIPAEVTAFAPIIVGVPSGTTPNVSRKPPEISRWVR